MSDHPAILASLDAYMAERRRGLVFPPAVEELYQDEMKSYRRKIMARSVLPSLVIYNVFLIADILLLPATALTAAILHFAVVTPIILLAAFVYPRARYHWLRELTTVTIPLAMLAQIMFIYALNRGTMADQYQYLAMMVVVYMNINLRFGFRIAVLSTLLLTAVYLVVLVAGHSPFEVKFTGACTMVTTAYLSLIANRRMEQDVRFNFLGRLRETLRRKSAEETARRDALTGLANRRGMDEVVETIWSDANSRDSLVAVVMIDIDHFKPFNDHYGHAVGDVCLKRIALAISSELRDDRDLAIRLGGEEFLLLLRCTELSEALNIAERVRVKLESAAIPHEKLGPGAVVTASFGVSAGPVSSHHFTELLAAADAALYAAKRNGRNQVWPPVAKRDGKITQFARPARGERTA
jgi:diguanylate cyclase (GGDEF)-like protein